METIAQRIERLQSSLGTQRNSPPTGPALTPPQSAHLTTFKTGSDLILVKMRKEGLAMIFEIQGRKEPRWLTLWGRNGLGNGTGKTFLSKLILDACKPVLNHLTPAVKFCHWPTLCERMQAREDTAHSFAFCEMAGLLVIDDIGAEYQTQAMLSKLTRLMEARLRKWTILTTNLNPDEWQKRDARISSRIIRGLNRHVQCETMDYALRVKQ